MGNISELGWVIVCGRYAMLADYWNFLHTYVILAVVDHGGLLVPHLNGE
jgi:hypothetical protein